MNKDILIIRLPKAFNKEDYQQTCSEFREKFEKEFYVIISLDENDTIKTEYEIIKR